MGLKQQEIQNLDVTRLYVDVTSLYLDITSQYFDKTSQYFDIKNRYLDVKRQYLDEASRYLDVKSRYLDVSKFIFGCKLLIFGCKRVMNKHGLATPPASKITSRGFEWSNSYLKTRKRIPILIGLKVKQSTFRMLERQHLIDSPKIRHLR